MKVCVDELPKSCCDCVFCKQIEYYYYCDKLHTKLAYIDKEKECPLQSLADHDRQVRKEVVDKVYKVLEQSVPHDLCWSWAVIKKELDQIQGETK